MEVCCVFNNMRNENAEWNYMCIRRILLFSGLLFPIFDYFLDKKENILKRILLER